MNRAEAIPVDGSRSTTEPPSGHEPAAPPPAPGRAHPQVTTPARPAGGGNTVAVRPPAPAISPYRGHRRADGMPDRLPVRHAETPAPEPWTGPPADTRAASKAVTRRIARRGAVAARRVVGL
ncbi:hypothetical protein [Actinoplanes subglobosus]|uniref:Uncharacterized protein n=1 Tax=Actinoplanes subglobosus TaxID=1547892 RepID=A0ABV8ISC5_9ACTN